MSLFSVNIRFIYILSHPRFIFGYLNYKYVTNEVHVLVKFLHQLIFYLPTSGRICVSYRVCTCYFRHIILIVWFELSNLTNLFLRSLTYIATRWNSYLPFVILVYRGHLFLVSQHSEFRQISFAKLVTSESWENKML